MHEIGKIVKVSKQAKKIKIYWKSLVSLPLIELGAYGVVVQCTNHYTNRAITILMHKLRYINITSTIQKQSFFSKRASL